MFYSIFTAKKLSVLVGVVKEVKFFKKDDQEFALVVLENRTGEDAVKVFFRNGDTKKLADRIRSAKVSEGAFLAVLCNWEQGKEEANGLDFKYRGAFHLKSESDSPATIIIGKVFNCRESKTKTDDPVFSCTIPVDEFVDGETITKWISISFFDNEKVKNAEFAKKLLRNGDMIAVRTGEIKEKESDSKTYYNTSGYRFEKAPYEKKE